ncbi:MAG: hypothetical protein SF162_11705 [bacterium]|nr:hypothetical protein [bacterium]
MKVLTKSAFLACAHRNASRVQNAPSQNWVTIDGQPILAQPDPLTWTIDGCPMEPLTGQLPCKAALTYVTGYSSFVTIDGHPICMDTLTGLTNGLPSVNYLVVTPGQDWVNAAE